MIRCTTSFGTIRARLVFAVWSEPSVHLPQAGKAHGRRENRQTRGEQGNHSGISRGIKIRVEGEIAERTERPGVAVGLAWTPSGGDVLFVEANAMKGKGGSP